MSHYWLYDHIQSWVQPPPPQPMVIDTYDGGPPLPSVRAHENTPTSPTHTSTLKAPAVQLRHPQMCIRICKCHSTWTPSDWAHTFKKPAPHSILVVINRGTVTGEGEKTFECLIRSDGSDGATDSKKKNHYHHLSFLLFYWFLFLAADPLFFRLTCLMMWKISRYRSRKWERAQLLNICTCLEWFKLPPRNPSTDHLLQQ